MKNLNLLIWLTQLGLSVAVPLAGFTILALWLRQKFHLGIWVLFAGIAAGIISAISSFRNALKAMEKMAEDKPGDQEPPPFSFNDHE